VRGGSRHHARMRRQYTGKQRAELVDLVRSREATVAEAAARLGVTPSTAYYWVRGTAPAEAGRRRRPTRAAKTPSSAQPAFVRVVPSTAVDTAISVRVGLVEIQVRCNFDPQHLRAVVDALGGGA
jgi:transposase-like protein